MTAAATVTRGRYGVSVALRPDVADLVREIVAYTALAGLLLIAALAGRVPLDPLAGFFPSAFLFGIALELGAFAILVDPRRHGNGTRGSIVLALRSLGSAFFIVALMLTAPVRTDALPILPISTQMGPWLYVCWLAFSGTAGMAYGLVRRSETSDARAPARFVVAAFAVVGLALAATSATLVAGIAALPPLIDPATLRALPMQPAGPVAAAWCLVAALVVRAIPGATNVDRAVALGLVAMALGTAINVLGPAPFSLAWAIARVLYLTAAAVVYQSVVTTLIRSGAQLADAHGALAVSTSQAARRAARIRALWNVATSESLSDEDHAQAILDGGATNLRPGHPMFGDLAHVEGDELVIDVVTSSGERERLGEVLAPIVPGARFPLDPAIQQFIENRRTHVWSGSLPHARPVLAVKRPWACGIITPFKIGGTSYRLFFGSPEEPSEDPFAEDDAAFVDVLASQLGHRFHQREQLARLRYQMEHDALTGLLNRTEFRKAARLAVMERAPFAVLMLDLDRYRAINETAGHLIGDEILVEIAATLQSIDERDVVARIGGDDFAVLLHGVTDERDVEKRISAYERCFHRPFHTGDRDGKHFLRVSASIGAAIFPRDAHSAEAVVQHADVALDVAKRRGGGAALLFADSMSTMAREAHIRHTELLEALEGGELRLEYQPTFELNSGILAGAEALVRWEHPVRGRLLPGDFVPFAERAGLSGHLSRWVLDRVCRELATLDLPVGFRCSFNLSSHQLDDPAFLHDLEARLEASPLLAGHLGIEITESEAMQNVERTIQALQTIKRFGLLAAIDDFGTGYSSMSYLKRLPIDVVKIDRSFVAGLPDDPKDVALAELFLQLTRRFNFVSLAEGIETAAQAEWLRSHGCLLGQGYLVARPMPLEDLARRMAAEGDAQRR